MRRGEELPMREESIYLCVALVPEKGEANAGVLRFKDCHKTHHSSGFVAVASDSLLGSLRHVATRDRQPCSR